MSIRDQLRQLVELQSAEVDAREHEAQLALLPAERSRLQARVQSASARVAEAEAERQASLTSRRALEVKLQAAEGSVEKYREHEMQVKTNEQLWALQAEIKTEQDKIDAMESAILEEMELADERARRIEECGEDLARVEAEVRNELAAVDASQAQLEARHTEELQRIEDIRRDVDPDLLGIYDRIRSVRGGVGIAEVIDGNCGACNVRLRPQLALEALNMEAPQQCDSCKRVLFSRAALELPSTVRVGSPE